MNAIAITEIEFDVDALELLPNEDTTGLTAAPVQPCSFTCIFTCLITN